jgi:hypothetical protein
LVTNTILIDEIIKFWDENPCNIRHGYSKYNTKEFFSEISARRYQFESANYCPHAQVFCPTDIQMLLKDKLKIQSIEQDHCFMYNVEEYKLGNYKLEPWVEVRPTEVKNVLNTQLGWHLLVNAINL